MPRKGQTVSEESIEKMKKSKTQKMLSKYKWECIEPYYDIIFKTSKNKKQKLITLREFRAKLESGISLRDIKKEGISKHLIQFYSYLSQGKINLSKDNFLIEYEKGLSLVEIAEKYNIPKDHIGLLRELYQVKAKGSTFIKRKKTETPLTQRQKDIIYGSMMGDAKKVSPSAMGFKHGIKQKDYLLWKYKELENISSPVSLRCEKRIDLRSENELESWRFYTFANTDIEKCILEFYKDGEKEVSDEVLRKLSPLSIAVWFEDDGKTEWHHNKENSRPDLYFCTDSFSKKSCENIKKYFKEEFYINTELSNRILSNKMGYRIRICKESIIDFIELIKPHVLPMFNYKIKYKTYLEKRKENETEIINKESLNCPLGRDFSKLDIKKQDRYISNVVKFYQSKGIQSLIEKEDNWKKHMTSVLNINPNNLIEDEFIKFSNLGNKFLMSHFSNFWDARSKGGQSPKEIFENKEYLTDIIRKIVIQGYFPSPQKILKNLQRYKGNKQVSGFMPCVAKSIYHKYCPEDSKVLDFCAGYGGRLFGAMSCDKVKSYACTDVNFKTYMNLHELYRTLRLHGEIEKEAHIFNQDSYSFMSQFADKSFDFCFTSPPYFDAEMYSDDDNQSCNKWSNYSDWFEDFLIKNVNEARRISKKVAINIANTGGYFIADDLEKYLKSESIRYIVDNIKLPYYGKYKFEPIFVI